jgi:hypothetical protein
MSNHKVAAKLKKTCRIRVKNRIVQTENGEWITLTYMRNIPQFREEFQITVNYVTEKIEIKDNKNAIVLEHFTNPEYIQIIDGIILWTLVDTKYFLGVLDTTTERTIDFPEITYTKYDGNHHYYYNESLDLIAVGKYRRTAVIKFVTYQSGQ